MSIAPVPKPGKDPSSFDSYWSIYILAGIFKLYDKILFNRIRDTVREPSESWQSGGSRGADQAVWTLDRILHAHKQQVKGGKTWMALLTQKPRIADRRAHASCRDSPVLGLLRTTG